MKNKIWIALDGPAGSGKSTIAKMFVQKHHEFIHINTGSMYRALAYFFIDRDINYLSFENRKHVLDNIIINFCGDDVFIHFDQKSLKVTDKIYNNNVAKLAAKLACFADVREKLVYQQRQIALDNNVIMDGRDIGTIVLPDATLKVYVIASVEKRAERRFVQNQNNNVDKSLSIQELIKQISDRDYSDMNREIGALKIADDAFILNNDDYNVDQCCDIIYNQLLIKQAN